MKQLIEIICKVLSIAKSSLITVIVINNVGNTNKEENGEDKN